MRGVCGGAACGGGEGVNLRQYTCNALGYKTTTTSFYVTKRFLLNTTLLYWFMYIPISHHMANGRPPRRTTHKQTNNGKESVTSTSSTSSTRTSHPLPSSCISPCLPPPLRTPHLMLLSGSGPSRLPDHVVIISFTTCKKKRTAPTTCTPPHHRLFTHTPREGGGPKGGVL